MPSTDRPSFQLKNVLIMSLVLALPVSGYFIWQFYQAQQVDQVDYVRGLNGYLKRMAPPDKLSDAYVDADGNLVADGPKNPADRINPDELTFFPGISSPPETEADWQAFMAHLAKTTGKKVKFMAMEDPGKIVEKVRDGELHVTSFSTGSVPLAVNLAGFVPVAALAQADGTSNYRMEIIVSANSPIKTPADLKGKKIILTSTGSHSGYKAPLLLLDSEFHLRPGTDYGYVVSGSHGESIKVLLGKEKLDAAAAVAADVLADAVAVGKIVKPEQYRSIYQSKPFPKGAWGYTCRLAPEVGNKVREAYLTFAFEGTPLAAKYKGSGAVKFAPASYKTDWSYVREIDAKMLEWK